MCSLITVPPNSSAFFFLLFFGIVRAPTRTTAVMGLFDKLKESFGGDDKPKSFQVTFMEQKMGMTISSGKKEEAVVTAGA